MSKKIVITGATGLIGRHLCRALMLKGYEVIATSRNADSARSSFEDDIKVVSWDGRNADQLTSIIDGTDAVFNLVGENVAGQKWSKAYIDRIISSRLDAGAAIKKAYEQTKNTPSVLVQASAIGYYANDLTQTSDETSACAPNFFGSLCRDWESSIVGMPASVRTVIARTGIVLARDGGAYPKLKMPIDFFVGATLGNGKQWFSWIHLQDEIDSLIFLMENEKCKGIYNLSAPKPATQKEVLTSLAKQLHRPLWFSIPAFILKAALGQMAVQTILASQKVLPKRLIEDGFHFKYEEIDRAIGELVA